MKKRPRKRGRFIFWFEARFRYTIERIATTMTLKPNYLIAFAKTFLWSFIAVALIGVVIPWFRGDTLDVAHSLSIVLIAPTLLAVFVMVAFTPREITWDEETIRIMTRFQGQGSFRWSDLEAWSPYGRGVFLIKFANMQTYQIAKSGFQKADWKVFTSILRDRFPDKKTFIWLGVTPIHLRKRNRH